MTEKNKAGLPENFPPIVPTGLWTFPIRKNGETLVLPFSIDDVFAFKVKSLTWAEAPYDVESDTLLWVTCNSLMQTCRSGRFFWTKGNLPPSFNGYANNMIASYGVALPYVNPIQEREWDQPIFLIEKEKRNSIKTLNFILEANHSGFLDFGEEKQLNITVQFYFCK